MSLLNIAHRGGGGLGAENSLLTIERSLGLGVDAIEIDVWLIDNQMLVTHDRRLGGKLCGEPQENGLRLDQLGAQRLRQLTLADGSTLPTLDEVIETIAGRAQLNIEIKGADMVDSLLPLLARHGQHRDSFLLSSFDHWQLQRAREIAPNLRRGALLAHLPLDLAACASQLDAWSLHPDIHCLNQALVDDCHQRGLLCLPYTVNAEDDFALLSAMGVDGVFTDFPDRLRAFNLQCSSP